MTMKDRTNPFFEFSQKTGLIKSLAKSPETFKSDHFQGKKAEVKGFTLLECLVVLVVLGLILGACYQLFLSQAYAYKNQARLIERVQGLRAALEIIARDCRSAGYPAVDSSFTSKLADWVPSAFVPKIPQNVTLTGLLTITPGGSNPDILSILTVLSGETNPTRLAKGVQAGEPSIQLALSGSDLNDQYNLDDMVYIGKPPEVARIKGISGRVLFIDTDPLLPGDQGVRQAYPQGVEVGEISLISYAVFTDGNDGGGKAHDPGIPVLKRKINAGGFEPLAEEITDLKILHLHSNLFDIRLSARTGHRSFGAQSPRDVFITLGTQVLKRN